MSQPGEDSRVALHKEAVLENKWKAAKARLHNIVRSIGTTDPSPCAAPSILEQLDQAKKYMASVFDERTAILAPTEQDKLIEDFNKLEKVYNEARSRLCNVESKRIHAEFPPLTSFHSQPAFKFFQFFQSFQFDTATGNEDKDEYLKLLLCNKKDVEWETYFCECKENIASDAGLEMLKMKKMPLTLLLERFRRCVFLLSCTGHDRDWKFLLMLIIRKCLDIGQEGAEILVKNVIRSLDDPEEK